MTLLLDFFSGAGSVANVAKAEDLSVWTTDIAQFGGIDKVVDILELPFSEIPSNPQIAWFSPPCEAFSVASISHHWTGGKQAYIPKSDHARLSLRIIERMWEVIEAIKPIYYFIENPRGVLRKMPIMNKAVARYTVSYCQYGDTRMKPTDIWTNNLGWEPRPICKNGDPCHERAPRGAKTGTQGRTGYLKNSLFLPNLSEKSLERPLNDAELTLSWLATAQEAGGGGIAAWRDVTGWHAPYPETTGYLIPTLVKYGRIDMALKAGEWLLRQQTDSGAFLSLTNEPALFDTAAVVEGMRVLYSLTEDNRYFNAIYKAAEWAESLPDIQWDMPLYKKRAAGIFEKDSHTVWLMPERSHYLAYWIEGHHLLNEDYSRLIDGLVIPPDGLLHFTYEPGWLPSGSRKDICATLQFANILALNGNKAEVQPMIDAVSKWVAADGGVPLDPYRPNEHYSWTAKFYLDVLWTVSR